eukprot:TRINITY_DN12978_c0_g1_i1.p1 TRINITY_DN12978_c0_g1~~TRINITY_DN12978_c0_g1_i1.p1  ORF type:complete len:106 (-),score=23.11 TRINITY_DN12978_c0_g1_i1:77-394(-)
MADKCAFCNTAICFGGAEENGKQYHAKCTPSARGVDVDALKSAQKEKDRLEDEKLRQEYISKMPENLGSIEVGSGPDGKKAGIRVNHITGEVRHVAGQPKTSNHH